MALKLLSHSVCGYVIKFPIEIIFACLIIFMCSYYAFSMKERIVEKRSVQYRPRTRLTPDDDFKLQQYRKNIHTPQSSAITDKQQKM
jgi:hypothetical protein